MTNVIGFVTNGHVCKKRVIPVVQECHSVRDSRAKVYHNIRQTLNIITF